MGFHPLALCVRLHYIILSRVGLPCVLLLFICAFVSALVSISSRNIDRADAFHRLPQQPPQHAITLGTAGRILDTAFDSEIEGVSGSDSSYTTGQCRTSLRSTSAREVLNRSSRSNSLATDDCAVSTTSAPATSRVAADEDRSSPAGGATSQSLVTPVGAPGSHPSEASAHATSPAGTSHRLHQIQVQQQVGRPWSPRSFLPATSIPLWVEPGVVGDGGDALTAHLDLLKQYLPVAGWAADAHSSTKGDEVQTESQLSTAAAIGEIDSQQVDVAWPTQLQLGGHRSTFDVRKRVLWAHKCLNAGVGAYASTAASPHATTGDEVWADTAGAPDSQHPVVAGANTDAGTTLSQPGTTPDTTAVSSTAAGAAASSAIGRGTGSVEPSSTPPSRPAKPSTFGTHPHEIETDRLNLLANGLLVNAFCSELDYSVPKAKTAFYSGPWIEDHWVNTFWKGKRGPDRQQGCAGGEAPAGAANSQVGSAAAGPGRSTDSDGCADASAANTASSTPGAAVRATMPLADYVRLRILIIDEALRIRDARSEEAKAVIDGQLLHLDGGRSPQIVSSSFLRLRITEAAVAPIGIDSPISSGRNDYGGRPAPPDEEAAGSSSRLAAVIETTIDALSATAYRKPSAFSGKKVSRFRGRGNARSSSGDGSGGSGWTAHAPLPLAGSAPSMTSNAATPAAAAAPTGADHADNLHSQWLSHINSLLHNSSSPFGSVGNSGEIIITVTLPYDFELFHPYVPLFCPWEHLIHHFLFFRAPSMVPDMVNQQNSHQSTAGDTEASSAASREHPQVERVTGSSGATGDAGAAATDAQRLASRTSAAAASGNNNSSDSSSSSSADLAVSAYGDQMWEGVVRLFAYLLHHDQSTIDAGDSSNSNNNFDSGDVSANSQQQPLSGQGSGRHHRSQQQRSSIKNIQYITVMQRSSGPFIFEKNARGRYGILKNCVILSAGGAGHVPIPLFAAEQMPLLEDEEEAEREVRGGKAGSAALDGRTSMQRSLEAAPTATQLPAPQNRRLPHQLRASKWEDHQHMLTFLGTWRSGAREQSIGISRNRLGRSNSTSSKSNFYCNHTDADSWVAELARSRFCFAPRGVGSSSFRLYECLQLGIPPLYIWDPAAWLPYRHSLLQPPPSVATSSDLGTDTQLPLASHEQRPPTTPAFLGSSSSTSSTIDRSNGGTSADNGSSSPTSSSSSPPSSSSLLLWDRIAYNIKLHDYDDFLTQRFIPSTLHDKRGYYQMKRDIEAARDHYFTYNAVMRHIYTLIRDPSSSELECEIWTHQLKRRVNGN